MGGHPAAPSSPPPAAHQEERVRFAWAARLFGRLLSVYVRFVALTSRVSGGPIAQGPTVLAFWHESNLAVAAIVMKLRDDRHMVTFSTRGFRGVTMNAMLEGLGAAVIAMPPEGPRGRVEAARLTAEAARLARLGWAVVVSCDGPFGPHRVAKPGALMVAREAGIPVVPWAVASRPTVRLTGRWDRQLIPLPFGHLRVEEGTHLELAPRQPIKPQLAVLQSELMRIAELSDRRMAYDGRPTAT